MLAIIGTKTSLSPNWLVLDHLISTITAFVDNVKSAQVNWHLGLNDCCDLGIRFDFLHINENASMQYAQNAQ